MNGSGFRLYYHILYIEGDAYGFIHSYISIYKWDDLGIDSSVVGNANDSMYLLGCGMRFLYDLEYCISRQLAEVWMVAKQKN